MLSYTHAMQSLWRIHISNDRIVRNHPNSITYVLTRHSILPKIREPNNIIVIKLHPGSPLSYKFLPVVLHR